MIDSKVLDLDKWATGLVLKLLPLPRVEIWGLQVYIAEIVCDFGVNRVCVFSTRKTTMNVFHTLKVIPTRALFLIIYFNLNPWKYRTLLTNFH